MNKDKITLYLLDNLSIIIGKDNGKVIDGACEIIQVSTGPALVSLFKNFSGPKELGITIEKKRLSIIAVKETSDKIAPFYNLFISGKRPETPKIISLKTH